MAMPHVTCAHLSRRLKEWRIVRLQVNSKLLRSEVDNDGDGDGGFGNASK